jgi:hypothetical protein
MLNRIETGEDVEPEDQCDACWERIKAAQNCPTCICVRDGTQDSTDTCWRDAQCKATVGALDDVPL